MKRIFKYLMMTVLAAGSMFYSCETTELEDLVSPNALSPDLASADLLLNTIQLNYLGAMQGMQGNGAALGRISYMFGRDYYNNFGSGTSSGAWGSLYSGILPDLAAIEAQNGEENLLAFHIGISKAMAAHIMMGIVDQVGDIPWSEANNPAEYPNPSVDDDAAVYDAAMAMLDSAESYLSVAGGGDDLFYGGDVSNWMKLVNTLRFRYHLTVGTDPNVILDFISSNEIISSADADFQFNYGDQELQPDTRHPWYQSDYTTSGANIYKSAWLMDVMDGDQDEWMNLTLDYPGAGMEEDGAAQRAVTTDDPRRRYYFYRQNRTTPGQSQMVFAIEAGPWNWPISFGLSASSTVNVETLSCSDIAEPVHLFGLEDGNIDYGGGQMLVGRWCSNFLGYWGRTHGNNEGTPPDNFTRTASGVYPAGGSFDNMPDIGNWDNYATWDGTLDTVLEGMDGLNEGTKGGVWQGNGGGGAGIWPIYLSSYVHFMVAETKLAAGDAAGAAESMRIAMEHSFAKVTSFSSVDPDADSAYFATAAEITDFIDMKVAEFVAAPETNAYNAVAPSENKDKLDVLGEQYFVAMFGGANDAWNFIRRTAHPRHLALGIMDNDESGPFPRTGTYPSGEISANPNILQRQDNLTRVFWDTNMDDNPAN
tara:strand:- start:716 stop:2662 length:1947 start_codon:yes stop_codon:yes gene_type:complete